VLRPIKYLFEIKVASAGASDLAEASDPTRRRDIPIRVSPTGDGEGQ
jgi:hypothetical protein